VRERVERPCHLDRLAAGCPCCASSHPIVSTGVSAFGLATNGVYSLIIASAGNALVYNLVSCIVAVLVGLNAGFHGRRE
jgi:hypothetical protein